MTCPLHKIELIYKGVHLKGCPECDHIRYVPEYSKLFQPTQLPFWAK